jgi:hypothetical protein
MRVIQKRTLALVAMLVGGVTATASACPSGCLVCTQYGDICVTGGCTLQCIIYPCIGPKPT